jgi:MoxR-like ATPase
VNEAGLRERLHEAGYIADDALATTLWLADELQRPLLIEGDAGVGKTALALAHARALGRRLVRLQCYEGLDLAQAAYEWNYGRQLLAIRLHETSAPGVREADLFAREYLLERPLLTALSSEQPCVRGLPARGTCRLADHRARTRHDRRTPRAGRRVDQQQHA